jgi:protein gp37
VADRSHIEWTNATWNPLVGCTKVSPGCDHCYAETLVNRFAGHNKGFPYRFDVVTMRDEKILSQPLRWRRPRRVFVNSLSDLFHADVPDEFIARVFAVMALAPQHTFQLLTKRHARMRSLLNDGGFQSEVAYEILALAGVGEGLPLPKHLVLPEGESWWPLPNVWLGVSVEDQHWADIRIPALLNTPAAVRWISAEPLLGPLKLGHYVWSDPSGLPGDWTRGLDWVVVGGESGAGARPMHPQWARDARDQCAEEGVPFLFKQWGEWAPGASGSDILDRPSRVAMVNTSGQRVPILDAALSHVAPEWALMSRLGKKTAGRRLDGRTHDGYPTTAGAIA